MVKAVSDSKLFPCLFVEGALCSYRKGADIVIMQRCFECSIYKSFMLCMDELDGEEDAVELAWIERENRNALCHFESCYCDGDHGKLACFGTEESDGSVRVWKCPRFHVEQLPSDSVMRLAYLDLVKGLSP